MIIDAHAHIYPEKIAEKATEAIGNFYSIPMDIKKGTPDFLIENGKKAGITGFLVHSVATKKEQVRSINDFIFSETQKHKEFIAFMTLHEDMTEEEIAEEITLAVSRGFKGIKLHPDFQRFYVDGDNAKKIYRVIKEMNIKFPILFHTGDIRYGYSEPERLVNVSKEFPSLYFIGAHFGCYSCFEKAELYKDCENVFFDTSSSLADRKSVV